MSEKSFRFRTTSSLIEITGEKAHHLKEFIEKLKKIDASCIFFHIHHSFREYTFAPGEYSNDFARWVAEDLEESRLAERLSSIDVQDFTELEGLRKELIKIIEDHLMNAVEIRKAPPGREFYFLRGTDMVIPTKYEVRDLDEFASALDKVGMRSLYYHFFDARLRLGRKTNDFSQWIRNSLGQEKIAANIERLDPYFITMDQLKKEIIAICHGEKPGARPKKGLLGFIKKLSGS